MLIFFTISDVFSRAEHESGNEISLSRQVFAKSEMIGVKIFF